MRPDWQHHVAEMLRGAREIDGSLFQGSERLSGVQQAAIYRQQWERRIPPALAQDAPGLQRLCGEDWDALALRYLGDHPPSSWSLDHLGHALEAWLVADGAPTSWVEMARIDEAVQRSFRAAEGVHLLPEQLEALPRLRLQPHVELVRVTNSVHRFRAESLGGDAPDPLVEDDYHLVIHRRERRVRHLECAPGAWRILASLDRGVDGAIAASGSDDPQEILVWFRLFVVKGLIELDDA